MSNRREKELYAVWVWMNRICYCPEHVGFPSFGGDGIEVCREWRCSDSKRIPWEDDCTEHGWAEFAQYIEHALGPRPSNHILNLIDDNKGWIPGNVRWDGVRRYDASNHWLRETWDVMNSRCLDPDHPKFPGFGAKGVGICDEWRNDDVGTAKPYHDGDRSGFTRFVEYIEKELGGCPEGCSLDRIDSNKGFEPDNVRWTNTAAQEWVRPAVDSEQGGKQRFIFGY